MEEKKVDTGEGLKLHIAKLEESEYSQKSVGSRAQEGRWSSVLLRREEGEEDKGARRTEALICPQRLFSFPLLASCGAGSYK